ncbi:MAG TPA: galactose oxidase-like domain-containing protein [Candidatus Dormibacteraeota bacterium]|nr:galactose oxidase-like domain-containing protein [Candidatus Dormibacteraeota bacterium]
MKAAVAAALLMVTPCLTAQTKSNAASVGQWQVLSNTLPLNPVHAAVMYNGKVLMIDSSDTTNPIAAVWDPATQTATTLPTSYIMFCNGMVVLPDGRPFVIGGTKHFGEPWTGVNQDAVYDPTTGVFTNQVSMARGRWYPTGTVLSDGTVFVFSGQDENDVTNNTVEIFTANTGTGSWTTPVTANWVPPLYPRMHLLPDGRLFYSAPGPTAKFYDLTTQTWTDCCTTNFGLKRTQSTSVLLPLRPGNNYKPRIVIMGGSSSEDTTPATNTTETVDTWVASPKFAWGPNMSQPRIHPNATILPTGDVLVSGGEQWSENTSTASLNADLYHGNGSDALYNTFTSAGVTSVPRAYHSNAILLPDATVITTGSNPPNVPYETRVELYQPPYLFTSTGALAKRPTITGVPTGSIGYNAPFTVQTPNASNIQKVVMMRPDAPTHAFDMEQRLVGLNFTIQSGALTVTSPPNANIAPPGYYMLFILNKAGVPSVAQFVQLCPTTGCM